MARLQIHPNIMRSFKCDSVEAQKKKNEKVGARFIFIRKRVNG